VKRRLHQRLRMAESHPRSGPDREGTALSAAAGGPYPPAATQAYFAEFASEEEEGEAVVLADSFGSAPPFPRPAPGSASAAPPALQAELTRVCADFRGWTRRMRRMCSTGTCAASSGTAWQNAQARRAD
jgi:hypothetical protein